MRHSNSKLEEIPPRQFILHRTHRFSVARVPAFLAASIPRAVLGFWLPTVPRPTLTLPQSWVYAMFVPVGMMKMKFVCCSVFFAFMRMLVVFSLFVLVAAPPRPLRWMELHREADTFASEKERPRIFAGCARNFPRESGFRGHSRLPPLFWGMDCLVRFE